MLMRNFQTSRFGRYGAAFVAPAWGGWLAARLPAAEQTTNTLSTNVLSTNALLTNAVSTNAPVAAVPLVSVAAPAGSVPATNVPATNGPVASVPVAHEPVAEAPVASIPAGRVPASRTPATTPGLKRDFASFRIITDRNIFNPNRRSRAVATVAEKPKPVRVDSFALLGTMSYQQGSFAFFDGTSPEFRKSLKPAEAIAGYKVKQIAPNLVKLEAGGKELELRVGMQMRRQDAGEWQLAARTDSYNSSGGSSGTSTDKGGAAASGGTSDLLKRLMEQRAKELNK